MATRKNETTDPKQEQLAEIKRSAAKRAKAQLKAAEAALSPLDKVISHQETTPANPILLSRVKGRIAAGQSRDEAIDAVLQNAREWLMAETTLETSGEN